MRPDPRFWEGRSVLVTGAAGLLGGWVVSELVSRGARVTALDIDWKKQRATTWVDTVNIVEGDVRDRSGFHGHLLESRARTVIHLAAQTLVGPANEDPVATFEHNIMGTWVVLESCRLSSLVDSVVAASSDKAYGDASGVAYEEEMPLAAMHPYAVSKAAGDLVSRTYAETYGTAVVVSRCGNLFGGGDLNWSRIIPGTIRSVIKQERPVIRSDGTFIRDYLYVKDGAGGILVLAEAVSTKPGLKGMAFNLASEQRLSVIEVIRKILASMDSDLEPIILDEAVNEIKDQRVGADKAREVLGWEAHWAFDDALKETIDWYRSHEELLA